MSASNKGFEMEKIILSDTENIFKIDKFDESDGLYLITNMGLESKNFRDAASIRSLGESIDQLVLVRTALLKPFKNCWVEINKTVEVGHFYHGKLSHHPVEAHKGFPSLIDPQEVFDFAELIEEVEI